MEKPSEPSPPQPNAFEKFVRRIAAVPKAAVDALESAEAESRKRGNDPKKKAS
jgi:hypothetical protein